MMLPIQRYMSVNHGMATTKAEFSKSKTSNQRLSITDRIGVLWGVLISVGIVLLSFGRSVRELTILGGITVGLSFGIAIGYSLSQGHVTRTSSIGPKDTR